MKQVNFGVNRNNILASQKNMLFKFAKISFLSHFVGAFLFLGIAHAAISDGGQPVHTVSITVPPGIHGMSPNLAITYGGSSNGALGYAWTLQAGSLVTRCPAIVATDGRRVGVNYVVDDKLCLNGQRLIRLNSGGTPIVGVGTNDAVGVANGSYNEFRTESDSYFRVRSYGYANGDTTGASGPAYFKVWTKEGQIIEYGSSPSADANTKSLMSMSGSTVGLVWATTRMSDVVGNHIDYKYEQRDVTWGSVPGAGAVPGHEQNLVEVQYSGNKVVFSYSDRPATSPQDASEAYNPLGKNVSVRRLNSITTYTNSPNTTVLGPAAAAVAVQTWNLVYDNGPVTKRSRLVKLQACAGGPGGIKCLPATSFAYAAGGGDVYVANAAFNQSTLLMQSSTHANGVILGDFNGDGKTDILRWSAVNTVLNSLLLSNGDGSFTAAPKFNITNTNQVLFSNDGCYETLTADVNGDGLPDLIRYSGATAPAGTVCLAPGPTLVFLNNGDGSFTQRTYSGPALRRDSGANFYFLDHDGDGKVDLITSLIGTVLKSVPTAGHPGFGVGYAYTCTDPSGICTHVYHGNGDGSFTEMTTNIGPYSVSTAPGSGSTDPNTTARVTDVDGDGLDDIGAVIVPNASTQTIKAPTALAMASTFQVAPLGDVPRFYIGGYGLRSHGDGNFDLLGINGASCLSPIDFNGDGRADCLDQSGKILVANPTSSSITNYNLTGTGQELAGTGVGIIVADVNGDGRQDIIRVEDDPSKNVVYLSNGDGTFTASATFNLAGVQLQKSDASASFTIGDFTGHGNVEILRMQTIGRTSSNTLYVKQDPTPPDQLTSVTSASGSVTSYYYVPLTNSIPSNNVSANRGQRYTSDRGTANAAALPSLDVTASNYVVATMVSDSGVGSNKVATEMAYAGLKVDTHGRGLLGFRDVKREVAGANGSPITTDNQYLQRQPYLGMIASSTSYDAALNAIASYNQLQQTTNVWCDQTAPGTEAAAMSSGVACTTSALVQRPYVLYKSMSGRDLAGVALPTSTTQSTVNANGDPTLVVASTAGTTGGLAQTFVQTTTIGYQPDTTTCSADGVTCSWILSRPTSTTVERSVPNSLTSLVTSAGTSAGAASIQGTGTKPGLPAITISALMSVITELLLSD